MKEVVSHRPGFRPMVQALLLRWLILLLRRYDARGERRLTWLPELDDEGLGRALAAMREKPAHPYTLPGLAHLAGMSRSVFAARFAETLGKSPMDFLKALRLARAAQLRMRTNLPVKIIAGRVVYSSRSSFSRAFRERHRVAPMAFRTAAREPAFGPATNIPPALRRTKRRTAAKANRSSAR